MPTVAFGIFVVVVVVGVGWREENDVAVRSDPFYGTSVVSQPCPYSNDLYY
jgi:hypothetical protein